MGFISNRIKRKIKTGFTLVELLIVVGILSVLLAIVLIAVNPLEQFNKTSDVATESVVKDYAAATKYFFTAEKTLPWIKDSACRTELSTSRTLSETPNCSRILLADSEIKDKFLNSTEAKDVYISECSNAVALCYKPKSKQFSENSEAKYTQNGVLKEGCPADNNDCYACTFTTNTAQECFESMNPNGTLAMGADISDSEVLPVPNRNSEPVCNQDVEQGRAACAADVVSDSSGNPLSSIAPPAGLGPEQLHKAYNLPCTQGGPVNAECATPSTFGPKTIALVLAYHAPTIENDLSVYSTTFGLPQCTKSNGCLQIVNQNGQTSPLPGTDSLWALEAALDVQMAHAICQTCKILVVEANTNYFTDLGLATKMAGTMGATVISNSYGNNEWSGSTAFDQYYSQPGIAVVASSGDWGYGTIYPASSGNVIGVGGTSLSMYPDNTYGGESVWNGAGSGCSALQTAQSFQTSLPNWNLTGCGTKKAVSDVSAVANPSTGVAIFNSTQYANRWGWWILGGTSASSPIIAAAIALQGGIPAGTHGNAFVYSNASKYRDVTSGSNGGCGSIMCNAGVGYDGPTGLGTPNFIPPTGTQPPTMGPPTSTPTPTPTLTPTPASTESGSLIGYIVNISNKSYTRVTNYAPNGKPTINCDLAETTTCAQIPTFTGTDMIGQCTTSTSGYAVYSKASCPNTATPTPSLTPTPTASPTPTLTPTATLNCNTQQTVTLAQSQPILALPGDTVNNMLTIKNNNSVGCGSLLYTISSSRPSGWALGGIPASVTVTAGEIKNIYFTLQVPANTTAGNYGYQFWVAKPGESSPLNTNGSVQVAQVGPTNTPTPTPINCFQGWTNTLGSTSMSGNAGDTLNQTLTITNNNPPSCGSALFGISYAYPSGWIINGLQPPSVTLAGGETKTLPITIGISSGAQVQDYGLQFWVNSGGLPMNATVHVLHTATPPEEQMFSAMSSKMYPTYATFEFKYNIQGAVSVRVDVATDPSALNQTSGANSLVSYYFAGSSGYAWDASNNPSPSVGRGAIVSTPSYWNKWVCGATIYYRYYNAGDLRIKSPIQSGVVDCNTVVNVLPWNPWYAAIYQGVYDSRYDADHNGVINYTDYWILVRATQLR